MIGESGKKDKPNSSKTDTIVLFDSSSDLGELREILHDVQVIISFDFESHKILSENHIPHEVSDNYLDKKDIKMIQKSSYILSKWFKDPRIVKLVEYENINLGQLLEVEFNYFLVPFLKKFVELVRIYKKYDISKFITSPIISRIMNLFTQSVTEFKQGKIQQNKTFFDVIKYDFKIGNNYFTIRLPQSYYKKLKSLSEIVIQSLFGLNKNNDNLSNKNILLVEFDPIRYKKIFAVLPETDSNIILYNRRRPSIWNFESYNVIKKSHCRVATHYAIVDNKIKNLINDGINLMESQINFLWNNENFFKQFFSIEGFSFWEIIKPNFMEMIKKRIAEYVSEIEITKKLLTRYKFHSIMVWSEIGSTEQIVTQIGKRLRIPITLLQHGLFFDTKEALDMNMFQGVFPAISDKYFVWGNIEKKHALDNGITPEKVEVMGSPLYDEIFDTQDSNTQKDFILLATSSPVKEDVHDLIVKTNENYEESIKKICEVVSKMKKKLVIKLHPSPDELDIIELAKKIDPKIIVVKGGDILPLIKSCEILITMDVSTVILESQLFKKPVISVLVKDYGWGIPSVFSSNSCITTEINNFENVLNKLLHDEDFKRITISNGTKFANEYLANQGTASKYILKFLSKM